MIGIRVERWPHSKWRVSWFRGALWIDCGRFTIDIGRLPV